MSDERPSLDGPTTPSETGRGRRVLLIVTGGIAAYKACTVVRRLMDAGHEVRVAMTDAATRFVSPMTFEVLSGQAVGTSTFGDGDEEALDHVQWSREADLVLVTPATANFLAKMANGLADDLCSTLITTATNKPIVVAPAMNDQMWNNPANRENLARLQERGIEIVEPGSGFLACGVVAEGRLAEPEDIVRHVFGKFAPGPLHGKRVLVTAGGTREPIDAVRYIGNRSTGRMGIALAEAALAAGAQVTLLLGPSELATPAGVELLRFESAESLAGLCREHAGAADVIFMSAAVGDYRLSEPSAGKSKKQDGVPRLELEPTEDILAGLGAGKRAGQQLVGFALETGSDQQVENEAAQKLKAKSLDLICGNRADVAGEGFAGDANRIYLLDAEGRGEWLPAGRKRELARRIVERVTVRTTGEHA